MSMKLPSVPRQGFAAERRQLCEELQPDSPSAVTKAPKPRSSSGLQRSLTTRHGAADTAEVPAASKARARRTARIPLFTIAEAARVGRIVLSVNAWRAG